MTLQTDEFIRRFMIHELPSGFHRIRHYGLPANAKRSDNAIHARELLSMPEPESLDDAADLECPPTSTYICRTCDAPMLIIDTLTPNYRSRAPPKCFATMTK